MALPRLTLVPYWECEQCGSRHYHPVIDLGNQACGCGVGKGLWFAVPSPESRMPMSKVMRFVVVLLSLSVSAWGQTTSTAKASENQKESSAHWIVATHPPPCIKGESVVTDKRKHSKGTYCMLTATQPKLTADPCDGVACWGQSSRTVQDGVDFCGGVPCAGNDIGHGDNTIPSVLSSPVRAPLAAQAITDLMEQIAPTPAGRCSPDDEGFNCPPQERPANNKPEPSKRCVADECQSDGPPRNTITIDPNLLEIGSWRPKQCPDGAVCSMYRLTVTGGISNLGGTDPFEVDIRCDDDHQGKDCFKPDAVVVSTASGSMVKLADSEYKHLRELRAAVDEEEKRVAVKYGAFLRDPECAAAPGCISMWNDDRYEYHGQFLLIEKQK